VDDQLVGDQAAAVHDALGLQAELGARLDRSTQHVAGGDLRNTELLGDEAGLSTFAGSGRPQQNYAHLMCSSKWTDNSSDSPRGANLVIRSSAALGGLRVGRPGPTDSRGSDQKGHHDTQRTGSAQATESLRKTSLNQY